MRRFSCKISAMSPSSSRFWKKAAFQTIARAEQLLRGKHRFSAADLSQIPNFLVLQQESQLGSVVHATPLYEALKCAVPDAHITVAASPMAAAVLQRNPHIDRSVVTPNPFADFREAARVLRALFQSQPDGPQCMVTTIGNQRTRLAMLGLFAGDAIRIGYTLAPELYDVPLCFDPERGQIEGNLDIVRRLGHDVGFYEPRVFFTQRDAERAAQHLESLGAPLSVPRVAYVTQNSGGQRNQWSAERFQQVVSILSQQRQAVPIFLGTAGEASTIEALRRDLPDPGISLAGRTTISELAAVLAQCDLVVSLDTGTFHVARAVGLPGVVISQAWKSPLEWLPVHHPRYRVMRGPTISEAPPDYWIEEVSADQVLKAATELMASYPADPAHRMERLQHSLR